MHRAIRVLAAAGALALVPAAPALAHGDHTQDDLTIVTGFAVEPAYAGYPNGVQVIVEHDGEPVTDLKPGDLTVEVVLGDQSTELALDPAFEVGEWGTPGDYQAEFIPSQPGAYTFHVTGAVDGEEVDFEMTSGSGTFSEVLDPAEATFPTTEEPSIDDLATRIEQEAARARAADEAVSAAEDAAGTARLVAIVAVVLAVIAIVLAITARTGARKRS
jgi:hypothetical protein